jgi:hypothetical protein
VTEPAAEAKGEVALSADILDYYVERAEAFLKPQLIPDAPNATIETFAGLSRASISDCAILPPAGGAQ